MTDDYEKAQQIIRQWKDEDDTRKSIVLSNLDITSLPRLPYNLKRLSISFVPITFLELPSNLEELEICMTEIRELPELPNTLKYLVTKCNILTCLPDLPESLELLSCSDCNLRTLPKLPSKLIQLDCNNNPLSTLPELPKTLITLNITYTAITELSECLPSDLRYININPKYVKRLPNTDNYSIISNNWSHNFKLCNYIPPYEYFGYKNGYRSIIFYDHIKTIEKNTKNIKQELELYISKKRTVKRCKAIKEDLMAATWHTDRVLDWCDPKAFDYED